MMGRCGNAPALFVESILTKDILINLNPVLITIALPILWRQQGSKFLGSDRFQAFRDTLVMRAVWAGDGGADV
jgi:hypothetical protein